MSRARGPPEPEHLLKVLFDDSEGRGPDRLAGGTPRVGRHRGRQGPKIFRRRRADPALGARRRREYMTALSLLSALRLEAGKSLANADIIAANALNAAIGAPYRYADLP